MMTFVIYSERTATIKVMSSQCGGSLNDVICWPLNDVTKVKLYRVCDGARWKQSGEPPKGWPGDSTVAVSRNYSNPDKSPSNA